jgi:hypothetical protein
MSDYKKRYKRYKRKYRESRQKLIELYGGLLEEKDRLKFAEHPQKPISRQQLLCDISGIIQKHADKDFLNKDTRGLCTNVFASAFKIMKFYDNELYRSLYYGFVVYTDDGGQMIINGILRDRILHDNDTIKNIIGNRDSKSHAKLGIFYKEFEVFIKNNMKKKLSRNLDEYELSVAMIYFMTEIINLSKVSTRCHTLRGMEFDSLVMPEKKTGKSFFEYLNKDSNPLKEDKDGWTPL